MVPEVADLHVFLQVVMVEMFLQPSDVTPVEVPVAITENRNSRSAINHRYIETGLYPGMRYSIIMMKLLSQMMVLF